MTYPLILAMERDGGTEALLRAVIDGEDGDEAERFAEIAKLLERTGALADCRALAETHAARAVESLAELPPGRAIESLVTVAQACIARRA